MMLSSSLGVRMLWQCGGKGVVAVWGRGTETLCPHTVPEIKLSSPNLNHCVSSQLSNFFLSSQHHLWEPHGVCFVGGRQIYPGQET